MKESLRPKTRQREKAVEQKKSEEIIEPLEQRPSSFEELKEKNPTNFDADCAMFAQELNAGGEVIQQSFDWAKYEREVAFRSSAAVGLDEHCSARSAYEKSMAWRTQLQRTLLENGNGERLAEFANVIKSEIARNASSFPDAVSLLQVVSTGYIHNWNWKNKERPVMQQRAVDFLNQFQQPSDNYFLSLTAAVEKERVSAKAANEWFNEPDNLQSWLPFRANNSQYAMLVPHEGRSVLLATSQSESLQISQLLHNLSETQSAYEAALNKKDEILAPYWGSDVANWPYDIIDIWKNDPTEVRKYRKLEQDIRSFFLTKHENQPASVNYVGVPRKDHEVGFDVFVPDNGVDKKAIFDEATLQLYFSDPIRKAVEEDLGFSLGELSLREQWHYFAALHGKTVTESGVVNNFARSFGVDGLRTFLVTANDENLREAVFTLAKDVPEIDAKKVFEAYGKLIAGIDTMGEYLQRSFGVSGKDAVQNIVSRRLDKARDLLRKAHEYKDTPDALLRLVGSVRSETQLLAESFKFLKGGGELKLENLPESAELSFDSGDGSILSANDVARVGYLIKDALPDETERYVQATIDGFGKATQSPDTTFFALRHKGAIVCLVRFDESQKTDGNKEFYIGSFYSDSNYGGGKLGEALFEAAMHTKRTEGASFSLHCRPDTPIARKYLDWGFIADSSQSASNNLGFVWHMRRDTATERVASKLFMPNEVCERASAAGSVFNFVPREISPSRPISRLVQRGGQYYAAFEELSEAA